MVAVKKHLNLKIGVFQRLWLICLPVVHWWKGHGATVHRLRGWRRQLDLVVVRAPQCPTLIGHHGPASHVMFTSSAWGVARCSHLGSQRAGRWARVGVGVAGLVHHVVVVLIRTVTPDKDSREEDEKMEGEIRMWK